ncbi:RNA polymerase sigma factor SigY [Terrilactibacillus sp. BCM23-1]|uniref:RNA polymerase sigma factor n=1 Tax=Terrilactibacillus tamarindi TaxID=2599694 RepID=A0A6N8CRL8_9BACI|nr:RNA polymerase sigma factor SigY [Terrilactibacillus tamarindi]MTT32889.1 RNA polymerase sigma factor SigY [Terrilactibacillus tamarindi]
MSDRLLIDKAKNKNKDAFAELFLRHRDFLYRYLLKLTLNPDLSEDIVQDTMLKSYQNIKKYNGSSSFTSWLITIANRIYFDILRKKKRERNWIKQQQILGQRKLSWQLQQNNDRWSATLESFKELKPDIRAAVLLKHYYGYTYDEIGKLMGVKSGTVKSRVHVGLIQLRKGLLGDEEG